MLGALPGTALSLGSALWQTARGVCPLLRHCQPLVNETFLPGRPETWTPEAMSPERKPP